MLTWIDFCNKHPSAAHSQPATCLQGADPQVLDQDLRTPLHLAILGNHLPVARLLLAQCGTGLLSRRDIMSLTPLHLAAIQGQVSMLRRLVSALREDTGPDTPLHTLAGQACEQVGLG